MLKNAWRWFQDFFGALVFSATQASSCGHDFTVTVTGTTPTAAVVDGSAAGELTMANSSATEVQNICISHGDKLAFDIDQTQVFRARIKQGQATIDSATSFAIGLAGDRNDAIDSIAQFVGFRLIGTNDLIVESDDGLHDVDDKDTGIDVSTTFVDLMIDLCNKKDVKFFANGQPVCQSVTFDMSNYTGSLQPYLQLQKTSDNNTDSIVIDYIEVEGLR